MEKINYFKVFDLIFEIEKSMRNTAFFISVHSNQSTLTVDLALEVKAVTNYDKEISSPSICINSFTTEVSHFKDLIGKKFIINTLEEAAEREDTFYVYEHETLCDYVLEILDIDNEFICTKCYGHANIYWDSPYATNVPFEIQGNFPILNPRFNNEKCTLLDLLQL